MNSLDSFSVRDLIQALGQMHSTISAQPGGQAPTFHFHAEPRQNKATKTTLTSNWKPLLGASYAFLIGATSFWAMPRNACAQVYVTEFAGSPLIGVVGKYDAKTGAAIN